MEYYNLEADASWSDKRADKAISDYFEEYSRSFVRKLFDDRLITCNGRVIKPSAKVSLGDLINITVPDVEQTDIIPEDIPLDIVYEDDDIIIVNKPKGMVVHPAPGHATGTLVNALMYHFGKEGLSSINGEFRPGIVHRIDMNTTGILVVCKNDKAHKSLTEQLKVHSITRKYYAIVCNNISEDEGTVNLPIGRHPKDRKKMAINYKNGRDAVTHYKVLERLGNNKYAFIECQLETGRTHQIRVHMSHIGHPLFNDERYGGSEIRKGTIYAKYRQFIQNCFELCPRQALHAKTLGFVHPGTGKWIQFDSQIPEDMTAMIDKWRNYVNFVGTEEDNE